MRRALFLALLALLAARGGVAAAPDDDADAYDDAADTADEDAPATTAATATGAAAAHPPEHSHLITLLQKSSTLQMEYLAAGAGGRLADALARELGASFDGHAAAARAALAGAVKAARVATGALDTSVQLARVMERLDGEAGAVFDALRAEARADARRLVAATGGALRDYDERVARAFADVNREILVELRALGYGRKAGEGGGGGAGGDAAVD